MKLQLILITILIFAISGCQETDKVSTAQSNPGSSSSQEKQPKTENESKINTQESDSDINEIKSNPPKSSVVEKKGKIETIYTDLDEKKCTTVKSNEDEAWVVQECPGVGGYKLEVIEGDLRQSINVIAPSGGKYQLDFQSNVSMAFSYLGKKAEWRVKKENGKIIPVGLITRLNAQEDPNNDKKITSYLVVTKFDGEFICVVDVVKPIRNANVKARQLADVAPKKPCLRGNS